MILSEFVSYFKSIKGRKIIFAMICVSCLLTVILAKQSVSGYHCIVIEDDIPSPFSDDHCIQKINKLLSKKREFVVEIAWSNERLLSAMNDIIGDAKDGEFKNEGAMLRGIGSFVHSAVNKGKDSMFATALSHCAWNIADNLSADKWFDASEWSMDLIACGTAFDWKEAITQSILWGTASGLINGGIAAAKQIKIVKWTYSPNKAVKTKE